MSTPKSEISKLYLIPSILAEGTALQMMAPAILEVIKETDYYFAENIKTARRYISELKTGRKIEGLIFINLIKILPRKMLLNYLILYHQEKILVFYPKLAVQV